MSHSLELHALLAGHGRLAPSSAATALSGWRPWLALIVLSGGFYGLAMGFYGGASAQVAISAVKVPLLIAGSTAIALPSLYVVNAVLGLHADFAEVLRGVFAAQATVAVAVALAALAPLLLFGYACTLDYEVAKAANGGLFLLASLAGQRTLAAHYQPLVARNARHSVGRRVWWLLYAVVTIQLAWVLRPFVGRPGMPAELFREEAWGNAYVEVLRSLARLWDER